MTHEDAITGLLALAAAGTSEAPPPTSAAREATIDHVAACSDCWQVLAALVGETGAPPGGAPDFGCAPVQDVLYLLVDQTPYALARQHPNAARHLGWCHACRTRFAEIVAVEREAARLPRWVEVGDRVREAVGRLVVRLGRTAAGLVEIPDAFVLGPALAPVPVRGSAPARDAIVAQSARCEIGSSDVWAEIGIAPEDDARAGLSIRLTSATAAPFVVHLRETRPEGDVLIGRYTLRGTEPLLVRGLWAGSFIVELHDPRDARSHRVRLDIGPGA